MRKVKRGISLLLVLLICLGVMTTGTLAADPLGDMTGQLVIIHTNDVHARLDDNIGYAGLAARVQEYEAAGADVLLLDAGDTLHGKPAAVAFEGSSVVEILNAVGYDAMVPGNHDFNYGYERLLELEEDMDFPLIAANVVYDDTGDQVFEPNTQFTVGGYQIGVFGLATVETVTKTNPNNVEGLTFIEGEDMYAIAQAQVDELTDDGCDIIICLGHLGVDTGSAPDRSTDVIEATEGIDLFIDGHSHTVLENGRQVNDTLLVQTGTELQYIGEVIYDGETFTASLTSAEDYEEKDEDIAALVEGFIDQVQVLYSDKIGETTVLLNGEREPGNRTEETNLGDLATDAIMYAAEQASYEVDVALTNGGGIRTEIAVGDITKYNLFEVFPFGNQVVVFDVPGSVLLEALEANTKSTPDAEGGFPQVSGIRYLIETGREEDRVTILDIGGEEFDPEASYTIATNDFIGVGGDEYAVFADYYEGAMTGINLEDALIDYIQDELDGVVGSRYAYPQGRILITESVPSDVDRDEWYASAVYYVLHAGLMQGTGDDEFAPTVTVNRAMVAQTFYNMYGQPEAGDDNFTDIEDDDWFIDAAAWSKSVGLFEGYEEGEFDGLREINRAELMQVFYNWMEIEEYEMTEGDLSGFKDADDVPEWAEEAITYCVGSKIISGKDVGGELWLEPASDGPRMELAQIFSNVFYDLGIVVA